MEHIRRVLNREWFWNIYLKLYDYMIVYPPYVKMLSDVFEFLRVNHGVYLDFGCGTGNFITYALRRSPYSKFYCLDLSPTGIKMAIEKAKREGFLSRVRFSLYRFQGSLPFDDNFFNGISAINVIQYLDKNLFRKFIEESFRTLKRGGRLVLVFPERKATLSGSSHGIKNIFSSKGAVKYSVLLLGILVMNVPMLLGANTYSYTKEEVETTMLDLGFKEVSSSSTYFSQKVKLICGVK